MLKITHFAAGADGGWPVTVLTVLGELDIATISTLGAAVAQILGDDVPPRIVFDMAGLTFCDATGLGGLVAVQRRCDSRGGWMRLARPTGQLQELLDITGLGTTMPAYRTVEQALTATPAKC